MADLKEIQDKRTARGEVHPAELLRRLRLIGSCPLSLSFRQRKEKELYDEIATRHLVSLCSAAVTCRIRVRSRPPGGSTGAEPTAATGSDLSDHGPGHHLPGKLYGFSCEHRYRDILRQLPGSRECDRHFKVHLLLQPGGGCYRNRLPC